MYEGQVLLYVTVIPRPEFHGVLSCLGMVGLSRLVEYLLTKYDFNLKNKFSIMKFSIINRCIIIIVKVQMSKS